MHHPSYTLPTLLVLYTSAALGDFLTPTYPTPVDLSSNQSVVSKSWTGLTSTFDQYFQRKLNATIAAAFTGAENVTFSVGMFSLNDPGALKLQYHHTAPEVETAKLGTKKVDENSIYHVASVSKLITVYAGMLELTDEEWNRPLSKVFPEIKQQTKNAIDVINTHQWDKITPWSLATQLSGLPKLGLLGDLYNETAASELGAPVLDLTSLIGAGPGGDCIAKVAAGKPISDCSTADVIAGLSAGSPVFLPWQSPVYSDLNFMVLGLTIANITGKSMTDVWQSSVFKPLGMSSSNDKADNKTVQRQVIVGTAQEYFGLDAIPYTAPSGGILSTLSDLQKLGTGILNNTLLPKEATDKWMKPVSHTSSLSYSIGAPWEIHRFVHPDNGRVTDIYTKLGDSGSYGGALAVIPQYNAGFALLNAANMNTLPQEKRGDISLRILDAVTNTVLPALEAEALAEAKCRFVGEYRSSGNDPKTSLKVAFNTSSSTAPRSDLVVAEWTYNGTDVLNGKFFQGNTPRLEQSIVRRGADGKPRQVAFLLSAYDQTNTYTEAMKIKDQGVTGTWTGLYYSDGDFVYTDATRWAGEPVRELVFDLDESGAAVKCTPSYERIELKKSEN